METIKVFCSDEHVYDNTKKNKKKNKIKINGESISVNYDSIIDTQFTAGNSGKEYNDIKDFLALGNYSKAPCGGFINFFVTDGDEGNKYIIYSGVNEISNSHYIVTIHKVIRDKYSK